MKKLLYLDGIRAIAALFVCLSHAYTLQFGLMPQNAWSDFLLYPQVAVDVFIVLSGYCLGYANGDRHEPYGTFMWRRCQRIFPAYYGAMLVSGLLYLTCFSYGHGIPVDAIALNLVMLGNLMPTKLAYFSPTFWTIGIEFRLYCLFPLLLWCQRCGGTVATIVVSGLVTGCWLGSALLWHWHQAGVCFPVLFACGLVAAQSPTFRAWEFLGLGSFAIWSVLLWSNRITPTAGWSRYAATLPLLDLWLGVAVAAFLAWLYQMSSKQKPHWLLALLSWRSLAQLASWSYSLYLLHFPLLKAFNLLAETQEVRGWQAIALETLPLLFCCYLFALVFERPQSKHQV